MKSFYLEQGSQGSTSFTQTTFKTQNHFNIETLKNLLETPKSPAKSLHRKQITSLPTLPSGSSSILFNRIQTSNCKLRTTQNIGDLLETHQVEILQKIQYMSPFYKPNPNKKCSNILKQFHQTKSVQISQNQSSKTQLQQQTLSIKEPKIGINNLEEKITQLKNDLINTIKQGKIQNTTDIIEKIMRLAVRSEKTKILAYTVYLSGRIFRFFKFEMADLKMKSLLQLGKVAMEIQQSEIAIKLFQKTLQYSWFLNDQSAEQEVYEDLGLSYYYSGNLEKSQFYHNRATQGFYESQDSQIRLLSVEILKTQQNTVVAFPHKITQGLLNKTDIHFIYIEGDQFQFFDEPLAQQVSTIGKLQTKVVSFPLFRQRRVSLHNRYLPDPMKNKSLKNLKLNGESLLKDLIHEKEFEVLPETPNRSSNEKYFLSVKQRPEQFFFKKNSTTKEAVPSNEQFLKKTLNEKIHLRQQSMKQQYHYEEPSVIYHRQILLSQKSFLRDLGRYDKGILLDQLLSKIEQEFTIYFQFIFSL